MSSHLNLQFTEHITGPATYCILALGFFDVNMPNEYVNTWHPQECANNTGFSSCSNARRDTLSCVRNDKLKQMMWDKRLCKCFSELPVFSFKCAKLMEQGNVSVLIIFYGVCHPWRPAAGQCCRIWCWTKSCVCDIRGAMFSFGSVGKGRGQGTVCMHWASHAESHQRDLSWKHLEGHVLLCWLQSDLFLFWPCWIISTSPRM